jgi:DNA-binding transcriptional ArsR family regulator
MEHEARILKALGDSTRLSIYLELKKRKTMNHTQICELFKMSKPSITHHLNIMRNAGILVSFKEQQFVNISINESFKENELKQIINLLLKGKRVN